MFAQYSPLFTSGLMSEHNSPAPSRAPSAAAHRKPVRESLPLTVDTASFSFYAGVHARSPSEPDAGSAGLFLTLMPRRRQVEDGRSFLSLDLAESQSMRSMSLRRKDTVTSRTTAFGRSEPNSPSMISPVSFSHVPFSFSQFGLPEPSAAPPAAPAAPMLRRSSREALRLPSPKPAPSSGLPSLPAPRPMHSSTYPPRALPTPPAASSSTRAPHRRRPSNLTLTLSACLAATPPALSTPSSPMHRPTLSAPSIFSPPLQSSPILSPSDQSYFLFSPASPRAPTSLPALSLPAGSPPSSGPVSPSFDAPPSYSTAIASPSISPLTPHTPYARALPTPPGPGPAPAPARTPSPLKPSLSMRSTVSHNTRQLNRSAALAALEGRAGSRSPGAAARPRNFMSMSDDDEDEAEGGEAAEGGGGGWRAEDAPGGGAARGGGGAGEGAGGGPAAAAAAKEAEREHGEREREEQEQEGHAREPVLAARELYRLSR
ncbi:hypothetical protein CERSUDRAFT_122336 [Gelatoporia subvermispora B]|uniref:Uncharacterized protein n=1 Tax=Ceriporiopsis subvermispora (strain B) TaxID=914234 RepID=M2QNX7_CERS8|nr:hypothetical protein CERSUDRAFT_122336 [Gelatoporia subvermispora B]